MLSYHVVIDNIDSKDLIYLHEHLLRYKPPYINIMGGSKFELAMQYVEKLYVELPETKVLLRRWPDDGILKRYNYNVINWFDDVIEPHLKWLQKFKPIWVLDNESVEDDLTQYAQATYNAMLFMHNRGLQLAVGRFAAGNPKESQYSQLDVMWQGLKDFGGVWSPNEYFDKPSLGYGSGSVARFTRGIDRCLEKFNFTPEIVIGEFGLANHYDPYSGWRDTGLTEEEYANLCLAYDRMWYEPFGITSCIFSVGKWKSFDVSQTFFLTIEKNKPEPIPEPLPEPQPQGCFDLIVKKPISQGVTMLTAIFEALKSILTNRTFMVPIIGGVFAFLVSQGIIQMDNPEVWTERVFQIILILMGMNGAFDIANAAKGNVWDSETKQWTKPE